MKNVLLIVCCLVCLSLGNCKKGSHTPTSTGHDSLPEDGNSSDAFKISDCGRCIVLNGPMPKLNIVDIDKNDKKVVWQWQASESNIATNYVRWFSRSPDEAKPVYDCKYLLITCSTGGVALIRIADKKAVFYAHVGKDPHSAELLPDGNIVAASSDDNRLVIFHVDTSIAPNTGYRKVIPLPFAHNVVWDKKRQVLWSAGKNKLYELEYNFDCEHPDLISKDSFSLPNGNAHDLFPVYGRDSLWFTTSTGVFYIDMQTKKVTRVNTPYQKHIKSVSSGPQDGRWPTIIMNPKVDWLSNEVIDLKGESIYIQKDMTIYKARWVLPNLFSYPKNDKIKVCG